MKRRMGKLGLALAFVVLAGPAMARLLLGRRADPKRTDNVAGMSALDYARQDPRAGAVLKLLEAKLAPARPAAGPVR